MCVRDARYVQNEIFLSLSPYSMDDLDGNKKVNIFVKYCKDAVICSIIHITGVVKKKKTLHINVVRA